MTVVPEATGSVPVEVTADTVPDEFGRTKERTAAPTTRVIFLNRVEDRHTAFVGPLKPEDIAAALLQAERGDMHAQADLFEQMEEKDGILSGHLQTRRLAASACKWDLEAKDESSRAKKAQEYVKAVLLDINNLREGLLDMYDATGKGTSVLEIDWTEKNKIKQLRWIHPKRYRFDWQKEKLLILPDLSPTTGEASRFELPMAPGSRFNYSSGIEAPEWKLLIHRSKMRSGHPARAGLLRVLVWAYVFRNYSLKDWSVFAEVFGQPTRIGKYPAGFNDQEVGQLIDALRSIGSDAYGVIDNRVELELMEASMRGNHPFEALYNAMERVYVMCILGQEQTSNNAPGATRAAVQFGGALIRQDLLASDCEDGQATIRRDLITPILGFGLGWDYVDDALPFFKFKYEPEADYQALAIIDAFALLELKLGEYVARDWAAKRYGITLCEDGLADEKRLFAREALTPQPQAPPGGTPQQQVPSAPGFQPSQLKRVAASVDDDDGSVMLGLEETIRTAVAEGIRLYNENHDGKGRFGMGGGVADHGEHWGRDTHASGAELESARKQQIKHIKAAPKPSAADVVKALADVHKEGGRASGDSRGGSAAARRTQRETLFNMFGGKERGYVIDRLTGLKMHHTDDPKLNPRGYPKFERGKIFVKAQGGGYQLHNLLPESFQSNRSRGDIRIRR